MTEKQLKLYVWEEVLTDYTDGIIVVLAHSYEEALEKIEEKEGDGFELTEAKTHPHKVVTRPESFVCWGGG